MKTNEVIGIDISKKDFDVRMHIAGEFSTFLNDKKGFKQLIKWVNKTSSFDSKEIFYVFEHTGIYSYNLALFLTEKEIPFAMVSGLEIKRSSGMVRGKSDRADSAMIARYGYLHREELKPYVLPSKELTELMSCFSSRQLYVKQRAGLKAKVGELRRVKLKKDHLVEINSLELMIRTFAREIKKIEKRMNEIVQNNQELNRLFDLITSVTGIGPQNAIILIATTHVFTRFETWRQYASYCGTAPFPHQSGTSIKGKTKVSHMANKTVKTLLTNAARSAIMHDPELKEFYWRKIGQGKADFLVINIIRNKLLARVFAVVKRGQPFVNTHKYLA